MDNYTHSKGYRLCIPIGILLIILFLSGCSGLKGVIRIYSSGEEKNRTIATVAYFPYKKNESVSDRRVMNLYIPYYDIFLNGRVSIQSKTWKFEPEAVYSINDTLTRSEFGMLYKYTFLALTRYFIPQKNELIDITDYSYVSNELDSMGYTPPRRLKLIYHSGSYSIKAKYNRLENQVSRSD